MAVTAQAGIIGFGPQAAKGSPALSIYRHRATMVDIDVADDVREGPPEVGGLAVPTFPYKGGPVVAGGFTIQPRLEDTLGWLLYGIMGATSTTPDAESGAYLNSFKLATDSGYVPWMTIRKYVPQNNGDPETDMGQQFNDCKLVGMTMTLPNDGPISSRVDAIGRTFDLVPYPFSLTSGPSGSPGAVDGPWEWANTMEPWHSIPVGVQTGGFIKIGGDTLPVVAAQVGFQNVPLDLRQERVYGDPFLEDVTVVQRRLTFDLTVKYTNPELYKLVLTGTKTGTEWSGQPHTGALDIMAISASKMTGLLNPWSLEITSDEVMMTQVGGITLAGNQAILLRFSGVALEATNYATFILKNKVNGYTWPA
jgi:hypothetical protein